MTDTNSNTLTASERTDDQSATPLCYRVAEAITHNPAKWLNPSEQMVVAHPLEDVDAEDMKEAFERQKLPDGNDFNLLRASLDVPSKYMKAVTAYLDNPDEWDVVTPGGQASHNSYKYIYNDKDLAKFEARQRVVERLANELHLISLHETEDLLRYNPETGTYREDGERVVRERLESRLQEHNTPSEANRIIYKLKNNRSQSLDAFAPKGKICLKNGVLDVSDPESPVLDDHAPEPRFRKRLPVEYDEDAACPQFEDFIEETVDKEDRAKLQEYVGYTVFHPWGVPYQKALMIVGPTAAGKSTLSEVITALIGESNTSHLSLQQLVDDEFARENIIGKVANICNDLNANNVQNVGLFKQLTAGDRVEANRKYEDYVRFRMTQKQIYAANRVPEVEYDDDAFYRRWLHVRFPKTIPPDDRNPQLEEELKEELSGVLNWALEGYARLRKQDGFTDELQIERKRELWKAHGHSVDRFMNAQAECVSGNDVPKEKVYTAYEQFCEVNNLPVEPKQNFSKYLKREYNISTSRPMISGKRVRCYQGVSLPDCEDTSKGSDNEESNWLEEAIAADSD